MWIVINDNVYNVTKYQLEHPGGPIVLSNRAGKHASLAFEQASHSKNAIDNVMPKYTIGQIDPNSTMLDTQKEQPATNPSLLIVVVVVVLILATVYALAS
jgi:cytochrome b involved in lipid metabolism